MNTKLDRALIVIAVVVCLISNVYTNKQLNDHITKHNSDLSAIESMVSIYQEANENSKVFISYTGDVLHELRDIKAVLIKAK